MSQAEREKWDARYAAGAYADRENPTRLVVDWLSNLSTGNALDVACGAGRNAIFLAAHGFDTDAIDISGVALERAAATAQAKGLRVNWLEADLDAGEASLPAKRYDLIVLVRYVDLSLYPLLVRRLKPAGILISEQHLQTELDVVGPRSPEFRLAPGALRRAIEPLSVLHDYEGTVIDPDGRPAALAQIVAQQ